MSKVTELLHSAFGLEFEIKSLRQARSQMVKEAQELCEHRLDSLREASHKSYSCGSSLRPFRVCLDCGLRQTDCSLFTPGRG